MTQSSPTQHGAALLSALMTAALVTTLATGAMWHQWRGLEVESAERHRAQARWLLLGSLDWARVILREDALADGEKPTDHLAEPWSVPLQEARLSSFLSALPDGGGVNNEDLALSEQVFLSGQMLDAQSRLPLLNLVQGDRLHPPTLRVFERLFDVLGLPQEELRLLGQGLVNAQRQESFVIPQRTSQLSWFGLRARTVSALSPHVHLLPVGTPVNVNTASAIVLYASVPGLSLTQAQRLVQERQRKHWDSLEAFQQASGLPASLNATHSVNTRFFEVLGRLRTPSTTVIERSLLERENKLLRVIWRESGQWAQSPNTTDTASLQ